MPAQRVHSSRQRVGLPAVPAAGRVRGRGVSRRTRDGGAGLLAVVRRARARTRYAVPAGRVRRGPRQQRQLRTQPPAHRHQPAVSLVVVLAFSRACVPPANLAINQCAVRCSVVVLVSCGICDADSSYATGSSACVKCPPSGNAGLGALLFFGSWLVLLGLHAVSQSGADSTKVLLPSIICPRSLCVCCWLWPHSALRLIRSGGCVLIRVPCTLSYFADSALLRQLGATDLQQQRGAFLARPVRAEHEPVVVARLRGMFCVILRGSSLDRAHCVLGSSR